MYYWLSAKQPNMVNQFAIDGGSSYKDTYMKNSST